VVPQLQADITVFFFLRDERDVLISFRRAGEGCSVEVAFIRATSSCLRRMLRQGLS
jgi:hypothetical protein